MRSCLTRGPWRTVPPRAACWGSPHGLVRGLPPRSPGQGWAALAVATLPPAPAGLWLSQGGKFNFYKINSIGAIFLAECGSNNRPLIGKGN